MADPALRRRMVEAGRRAVIGTSWASVCDELLGHYRSVMGAKVPAKRTRVGSHA